eukprot:m.357149 g.357149  ORF g.357149 m.357149 type:complete len:919 (+) comp16612_c0_seq2:47-2803(+)
MSWQPAFVAGCLGLAAVADATASEIAELTSTECVVGGMNCPQFDPRPWALNKAALQTCLETAVQLVVFADSSNFTAASRCRNSRFDLQHIPAAVARVRSTDEAAAAVRCAVDSSIKVCARAGRHGMENTACCPGGLIVDVADLDTLEVLGPVDDGLLIRFGAGHTNGQLYTKLSEIGDGWVFPGGTEATVGMGLTLGCGRGLLTQVHGLSCDKVKAVEYVNAEGRLTVANATHNADVFWVAKGGGGYFPGVVTSFTASAPPMPKAIHKRACHFDLRNASNAAAVVAAWERELRNTTQSARSIFNHLSFFGPPVHSGVYEGFCFDCTEDMVEWFLGSEARILGGIGNCHWRAKGQGWVKVLKQEPLSARLKDGLAQKMGWWLPHRGDEHDVAEIDNTFNRNWDEPNTRETVKKLVQWMYAPERESEIELKPPAYNEMFFMYALGGDAITRVPPEATVYGHRHAAWTFHFKHRWSTRRVGDAVKWDRTLRRRHRGLAGIIGKDHCHGYLNYLDRRMECAVDTHSAPVELFGEANAARLVSILRDADPRRIFGSKWGGPVLPPANILRQSSSGTRGMGSQSQGLSAWQDPATSGVSIETPLPSGVEWSDPWTQPEGPSSWGRMPVMAAGWVSRNHKREQPSQCGTAATGEIFPLMDVSQMPLGLDKCGCEYTLNGPGSMPFEPRVKITTDSATNTRQILANSIPSHGFDHMIAPTWVKNLCICPLQMKLTLPLTPTVADTTTELPVTGPYAITTEGVNLIPVAWVGYLGWHGVVGLLDGQPGSPPMGYGFHYHWTESLADTRTWGSVPPEDRLVGWAFDGFPIYGALGNPGDEAGTLDRCNGRYVNGHYQYHIRRLVNYTEDYCESWKDGAGRMAHAARWRPIIGCYRGDPSLARGVRASDEEWASIGGHVRTSMNIPLKA